MANEYQLVDGTPRYGTRTGPAAVLAASSAPADRVEKTAEAAARLDLDHLAAAIDRRLRSAWADNADPVITALRKAYPEELLAARALVKLHLGSQRSWLITAQAVRDRRLETMRARRRSAGSTREALLLRLVLLVALVALPSFVVATSTDLVKLIVTGLVCLGVATSAGHFITVRARVPVMPNIRRPWLAELREDIVNATLADILASKGDVEPATALAARRGWQSITVAAAAVDALNN
jgi:hypothetical protein